MNKKQSGQAPSVGRIVHFYDPFSSEELPKPEPAIVLDIKEEDTVMAKVFRNVGRDIVVMASYSERPKKGHWSWPDKVP